jgi:hypothetical protein
VSNVSWDGDGALQRNVATTAADCLGAFIAVAGALVLRLQYFSAARGPKSLTSMAIGRYVS